MILIVGAGGHGQVVADIFRARRERWPHDGRDRGSSTTIARRHGVLHGRQPRARRAGAASHRDRYDAVVVAIGDNAHARRYSPD